jgi:hypothetical protein
VTTGERDLDFEFETAEREAIEIERRDRELLAHADAVRSGDERVDAADVEVARAERREVDRLVEGEWRSAAAEDERPQEARPRIELIEQHLTESPGSDRDVADRALAIPHAVANAAQVDAQPPAGWELQGASPWRRSEVVAGCRSGEIVRSESGREGELRPLCRPCGVQADRWRGTTGRGVLAAERDSRQSKGSPGCGGGRGGRRRGASVGRRRC